MRTQNSLERPSFFCRNHSRSRVLSIAIFCVAGVLTGVKHTQSQEWTRKLHVYPKASPEPALKIRLVPDESEQLEGNSAIFYLKAMGFLEQDPARDRLRALLKKASEQAEATGKQTSDYPPYQYLDIPPEDYPKEDVRAYLALLEFQVPSLKEARLFRDFTMHRNIHRSENPLAYLLPEMQAFRELARHQRIRCRLAIAEDRITDAIEVIGQQLSMSRHIAMDDFLVSYLVGGAVFNIAFEDTLLAIEHQQCPNLYWAFAHLPNPLMNPDRCIAIERQFVYIQVPRLKEVDTTPRPESYWSEFLIDFANRTSGLDVHNNLEQDAIVSKVQGDQRVQSIEKLIEENVPQAKEYLVSRGILTKDSIESYVHKQLVFLAMKDYYEVHRDEQFKWFNLPYESAIERLEAANSKMITDREKFGWFTWLPTGIMPTINAFYTAVNRGRQRIAAIEAIEAIRMAAAENGGKLIDKLDQAPVPVPVDPFTGKAFSYQVLDNAGVITSMYPENAPLRIEVHLVQ